MSPPTIIAIVSPRPFRHRALLVQAIALWFNQHARRCLIVDFDPSCEVSFSILPGEQWNLCTTPGDHNVGRWFQAYRNHEQPTSLLPALVAGELVPGWLDAESCIPDLLGPNLRFRYMWDPTRHLQQALRPLASEGDVVLLVAPVGTGVLFDLVLTAASSVIGLIRCDRIALHDVARLRDKRLPLEMGPREHVVPRGGMRFVWPKANLDSSSTEALLLHAQVPSGLAIEGLWGEPVSRERLSAQLGDLLSPVGDLQPL